MHPPKYKALQEATGRCVAAADNCFGTLSAYQVAAACTALQTLAAVNSTHVPAFAKAVGAICVACQTECGKFPAVAECKACATACKNCADECRKASA